MKTPAKNDPGKLQSPDTGAAAARSAVHNSPRVVSPARAGIATRIVLIYLVIGILWIVLSDALLNDIVPDPLAIFPLGIAKGIFFVLVTGAMLWLLINRGLATIARSERQASEGESRFRAMFDNAPDAMLLLDASGRINRANDTVCRWLGRPRDDLEGRYYYELVEPELRPAVEKYWQQLVEQGQLTGSIDNSGLENAPTSVEFSAKTEIIPGYHLAVIRDVSERTVYQHEIEASERRYRVLMEQASEGIFIAGPDWRLLDVNSRACELLGYRRDQLIGLPVGEILVHDVAGPPQDSLEQLQAGKTVHNEHMLKRKDGSLLPVETSTKMVEEGMVQGIVRDISERKAYEQQLVRRNGELNALYETTLGLITRLDPDSLLDAVLNRAADLIGTDTGFLYVEDDGGQEMVQKLAIGVLAGYNGLRVKRGDGISGTVWQTGQPLTIDDYQQWASRRPEIPEVHASIAAPLRSGDRTIGVIGLAYTQAGKVFDPDAMNLLSRFADIASLTLHNAQLYTEAQREIAERRRSEEQLRLSEERLKAQYKGNPVPTYSWQHVAGMEDDFVLIDFNDAGYAATGGLVRQLVGRRASEVYEQRPDIIADFVKCYNERTIVHRETEYTFFTTGEEVYQSVSYAYVPPDLVMLHADDISERKAYEQSLVEHASEQARLLNQLLTAQEAERRRVSMDIHDGPLQSLGVSLMAIDRAIRRYERREYDIMVAELRGMRSTLAGTVAELRAVLADLSLEVLKSAGLEAALLNHIERFSDVTGIHVDFTSKLESRLPPDLELLMYRLAQEALSNIRKHSGAKTVDIRLDSQEGSLHMAIRDDGEGFDPDAVLRDRRAGERIGLRSMAQRIEDAGGGMEIHSAAGEGTRLEFWCPLPQDVQHEPRG